MFNKLFFFMSLYLITFSYKLENSLSHLLDLYLQKIYAKSVVCIICWKMSDSAKLIKHLNNEKLYQISVIDPELYVKNIPEDQWYTTLFVLDFSCEKSYNVLLMAGNQSQFKNMEKWLILTNKSNEEVATLKDLYKNIKFRLDSDVKIIVKGKEKYVYLLYDVFNPGFTGGGHPEFSLSGKYNTNYGKLELDLTIRSYEKRKNLTDVLIRMATVPLHKPENQSLDDFMENPAETKFISHTKFYYRMCKYLKHVHGFSNRFILSDKWFGDFPNGTDSGVSKLVYEGTADLSCTSSLMKPERFDTIGILLPHFPLRSMFIFRNMGHHALLKNEFLKPFSDAVWISCLICIVIIALSFKSINWFDRIFMKSSAEYSWFTAFLVTVSAFLQKELSFYPAKTAGRIVHFTLMTLVFLLYNYYTSSIVASLINTKPEPIKTFEMLGKTKMACYIENIPYMLYVVKDINNEMTAKFFKEKVMFGTSSPHFETIPVGIANVKKGEYAYHTEDSTAYPLIEKTFDQEQICQLEEITVIGPEWVPMVIQRHSQYMKLFRVSLRKMETAGIIKKEVAYWKARKPICFSGMKFMPVEIEPLFMAFFIYFIMIICSILILAVEIVYNAFKKRVNKTQKIILVEKLRNPKNITSRTMK